jgi:microcystin-dependent protein
MSEPFIGEIRMWPGNFAIRGFAFCNGQLLPISQNTALFSILGTTYGGDGRTNFGLPNLQGSVPVMAGQGAGLSQRTLGETGGETSVTVLQSQMPAHNHTANGDDKNGGVGSPIGAVWGAGGRGSTPAYSTSAPNSAMSAQALTTTGGNQPHNNMSPYLTVNFLVALVGIFPARN